MSANRFFNLRANAHHRIQPSHRFLKNHGNLAATHVAPLALDQLRQILPFLYFITSLTSFPSSSSHASPRTRAPGGNKPINASASMVFPLPDSPTSHSDSPAPIVATLHSPAAPNH
jgi:hypothetical protein